ncbi:MAG: hypothetical protein JXB47_03430, partial [Anaerolineae bacterium]|nr:hypothetical protein [Anaerolineae bacterium]
FQSFWARFGSGAVGVEPLYRFFELLTLAALAGLVVCAVRSLFARPAAPASWRADAVIVGSFALGWAGGLSYAGLMWMGNQGRYLLPGIAAWTVLIALGLRALTPKRWHALLATSGVVVMAAIAVICLAAYFVPAYRVLPVPGDIAHPLGYRYGETVELIGTDAAAYTAQPGELIWITLYWRALRPADADLRVALHALDSDLVRRDSLPAAGKLYAPDWQPGMTWADRYVIEVPPDAGRQTVYSFRVGVYDVATGASLPAAGPDGEPAAMVVGGSVILHGLPAQPPPAYRYRFGAGMGLQAPQILQGDEPGRVNLCLAWVALAPMPANYHRFVHALLDDGTRASLGADGLIGGARYPTSAWLPGEKIEECIPVDARALSPGSWRLGIGAYDYESGARLPAQSDQGEILDGDTVVTDESP